MGTEITGTDLTTIEKNVHCYAEVSEENRNTVKQTVFELYKRANKNKEFIQDIQVHVAKSLDKLPESDSVFLQTAKARKDGAGVTVQPIFNNNKKEIAVSADIYEDGSKPTEEQEVLKGVTLHEIGHRFDGDFAKESEYTSKIKALMEKLKANPNSEEELTEEENLLIEKYLKTSELSDSDEFKAAWKADVEELAKYQNANEIMDYLKEFSPTYENDKPINIFDGVSKEEIEDADSARSEVFAQSFSILLGGNNPSKEHSEFMAKIYPNSFKVVKKFIKAHLGIDCNK